MKKYNPLKIVIYLSIFILLLTPSKVFAFSGGTGSEESPYLISTPDELNSLRNYLGSGYSNTYFKLANSIDMDVNPYNTGSGWEKLGSSSSTAFYGHFDGDNNIIYNLYIYANGTQYNSLFGYLGTGSVVENLGLEDLDLTLINSQSFAYNAGIAGYNYGTIQNTYVTGTITGANHYTGGIAAYNGGTIQRCYSDADITGIHYNGGIVARAGGVIQDVYNTGTVNGSLYTAGIAGQYYIAITRAYNAGVINGGTEAAIASLNGGGGSFVNCYYDSEISSAGGGGTATTTANMKLQSTYENWDFNDIWAIDTGNNDGYPYFQWQDIPPSAPPTVQATNVSTSEIKYNQMKITWTNGDGNRRMIFMKEGTGGTTSPVDASGYVASSVFGSGSQIGTSGWYAVYDGILDNVTVTNLDPNTTYTVQVFEYNGKAHNALYLTSTGTNNPKTISTIELLSPTTQSSNISFSSVASTTLTINWDAGNGDGRIVLMKRGSTGTTTLTNETTYTADSVFGDGDEIGSSGWYVVYKGNEESTSVSGLIAERDYIVQIIEYNGSGENIKYNVETSTNNPNTTTTTEFVPMETFETGDFSLFEWIFSGTLDWTIEESTVYEGTYSARSGNITHSQTTTMSVTIDIPEDGTISFYRKVSSEGSYDYLRFYIDGVTKGSWSGSYDWAQVSYAVSAGTRTFTWTYSKDGSVDSGSDAAYIDNIDFPMSDSSYTVPEHTITYSSDTHGTISGTSTQTVEDGSDGTEIEAIPTTGFHFVQWSDGSEENPRTDLDVGHSFSVEAQFDIDQCTVIYTAGSHGYISGLTPQTVDYGSNTSLVKAIANTGYHFVKWSDNSTNSSRTDTNVISNISLTALFSINTYTVTYKVVTNGTIIGSKIQTISYGGNTSSVTAIPISGYRFVKWSDDSTTNPRTDDNVTKDTEVTATFEKIPSTTQTTSIPASTTAQKTVIQAEQIEETEEQEEEIEEESTEETEEFTKEEIDTILKEEKFVSKVYKKENQLVISNVLVRILDSNGNPLAGVKVTLYSDPMIGYTDEDGIVIFKDVPVGEHHIEFDHKEQEYSQVLAIETSDVEIEDNEETEVEIPVVTITASENEKEEIEETFLEKVSPYLLYGLGILGTILLILFIYKNRNKHL